MSVLTDYLEPDQLQQLQDAFARVVNLPIRLCGPNGQGLTEAASFAGEDKSAPRRFDVPILVDDQIAGRVVVETADPSLDLTLPPKGMAGESKATRVLRYLGLIADMVSRLCDKEKQLRTRIEELGTLYRLTAEFSGQRDLQDLLNLVAQTVVKVHGAKACSIRLLEESGTELVRKAAVGLSPGYLDKGPILVSESKIDQEVLTTGKPVYVADERTDPRVLYPAEAREEGIVSALCAALVYKGRPEGVIHVYTGQVYEFDRFEVSLLEAIAAEAAAAIASARFYAQSVQSETIRRQVRLAASVQRRMIPTEAPKIEGYQFGAVYVPCFELGGDFYDFIDLPENNLGLVVCDVVGKGVGASLLMASVRASLRAHATNIYSISDVLSRVNRDLCADTQPGDFATMFYAVLDIGARRLTYANAGHIPPLLFRGGEPAYLDVGGGVLGVTPEARWEYEALTLHLGDVMILYTDGLMDAMNFEGEPFGRRRVEAAAAEAVEVQNTAEGVVKHLLWEMRRFAGLQTRFDDLTMVATKVT